MAQTYTINGTDYSFPDVDDSDWGQNVTDWAGAVSSFLLQRSGGTFTLGAVVDFGTGYGLKIKDLESKTASASTDASAFLRMAKGDYLSWRNNAEGADLALKKNTSDRLEFATKELINVDAVQTMSSKTLTSPVINTGISGTAIDDNTSLGSSATKVPTQNAVKSYVDAQVTASDLDFSGNSGGAQSVDLDSQSLTLEGAADSAINTVGSAQKISFHVDIDGTTDIGAGLADADLLLVDDGGAGANRKSAVSRIPTYVFTKISGDITIGADGTAAIGSGVIVDADVKSDAAIAQSKLNLSITNSEVNASAAIADTKLDTISTANKVSLSALDIDGATDIGEDLADADLLAVDNAAGGTNRKTEMSRVSKYAFDKVTGDVTISSTGTSDIGAGVSLANPVVTNYMELDHQASDPAAPGGANDVVLYTKTKKVYTRDGAGTVTELGAGGGGAGDADTIQLKTAEASEGTGSAPWYTGQDTVPGSDQGTLGGTWELSTSNPLINTNDATKVFHYSNGTSDRKGDYFEIELDVPNYAKGHNLVVQLFYRTVGAEDTDFLFFARDRTGDYETTFTTTGTTVNAFVVASATGFAVGDRICFEDGSGNRYFRYITTVASTTITFSGAGVTFAVGTKSVVSKFFTDELNFITAENNTTNYEGKIRKWAFQINDTTTKIRVGFLYDNSATSTNELFFDQILLSANQFLQTSSQGQTEEYSIARWTASAGCIPYTEYTPGINTIDKLGTVVGGSSTVGWSFTAKERVRVTMSARHMTTSGLAYFGITAGSNASQIKDTSNLLNNAMFQGNGNLKAMSQTPAAEEMYQVAASFIMEKGDVVCPRASNTTDVASGPYAGGVTMTVEPLVNDVVLLNSQDEIFTDWVDYTDVFATGSWWSGSANTISKAIWRRVGGNMEIKVDFHVAGSGSASTDYAIIKMPPGYTIDINKTGGEANTVVGNFFKTYSTAAFLADGAGGIVTVRDDYPQYLYMSYQATSTTAIAINQISAFVGVNEHFFVNISVPIQGWTSTFNPVLSMPLVDIGSDVEQFIGYNNSSATGGYGGTNTYVPYWGGVSKNTTGSLVTITNDSSTSGGGLLITANQRVRVSGSFNLAGTAATHLNVGWTKNASSYTTDVTTLSNTNPTQVLMFNTGANVAGVQVTAPVDVVLEAGDKMSPQTDGKAINTSYANVTLTFERDRSHTNMAHIIKPAVAVLQDVRTYDTAGDTAGAGGFNNCDLNTISGESWFVSLVGGSDTDFDLEKGMYKIVALQPSYQCNSNQLRLYNVTDSTNGLPGLTGYSTGSSNGYHNTNLTETFTITKTTRFRLQFWATSGGTMGVGASWIGSGSGNNVYTQVTVEKLK
jgi:hypothetical protein